MESRSNSRVVFTDATGVDRILYSILSCFNKD